MNQNLWYGKLNAQLRIKQLQQASYYKEGVKIGDEREIKSQLPHRVVGVDIIILEMRDIES